MAEQHTPWTFERGSLGFKWFIHHNGNWAFETYIDRFTEEKIRDVVDALNNYDSLKEENESLKHQVAFQIEDNELGHEEIKGLKEEARRLKSRVKSLDEYNQGLTEHRDGLAEELAALSASHRELYKALELLNGREYSDIRDWQIVKKALANAAPFIEDKPESK